MNLQLFKLRMKWLSFKRKYFPLNKYFFKRKYFYKYQSDATIAARRLIVGFYEIGVIRAHTPFADILDREVKQSLLRFIIDVSGKIKGNILYITVITDRPGILIGKGGRSYDEMIKFCKETYYFMNNKLIDLKIHIEESQYWPPTFQNLRELEYEDSHDQQDYEDTFNDEC